MTGFERISVASTAESLQIIGSLDVGNVSLAVIVVSQGPSLILYVY